MPKSNSGKEEEKGPLTSRSGWTKKSRAHAYSEAVREKQEKKKNKGNSTTSVGTRSKKRKGGDVVLCLQTQRHPCGIAP